MPGSAADTHPDAAPMTSPASSDPPSDAPPPPKEKRRSGGRTKAKAPRSPEPNGVLAALRAGLEEALPGLEILDEDLSFEDDGRADLAAVDGAGRLVLVLIAGRDDEPVIPVALDALAYARANTDVLARHLEGRVEPGQSPRVVVIDPGNDPRLGARLALLAPLGVEVFGVRTVKSARGEHSYLVASERAAGSGAAPGPEPFLEALPEPLRELGRGISDRMSRLDEELVTTGDPTSIVWRLDGEVLARVDREGSNLRASLGAQQPSAPIRDVADVDRLVEGALGRLVEHVEGLGHPPEPRGAGALPGEDEPLLTAEELEAFRS